MLKLTAETKVGIFVFLGLLLLVYMSLKAGGLSLFGREDGYILYVKLESAAGLENQAPVAVAGVEVGKIREILLENNKAKLAIHIKPGIKIGSDFIAVLKTKGLLGEKYLELVPGSPNAPALKDGEEITRVATFNDMDKLVNALTDVAVDIKEVSASLSHVLGGREGEATLRNIVHNIEEITYGLNRVVKNNDQKFDTTMTNLQEFSENINEVAKSLNSFIKDNKDNMSGGIQNLQNASKKLEEAMDTLNKVGPKIQDTVESIGSVAKKIDNGQGTIGKLINDPSVHDKLDKTLTGVNSYIERTERFRTYVGYRGEYISRAKDMRSTFSLKIQPKSDKYYLLEVIDDPYGKRNTKTVSTTPGSTQTILTTKDAIKVSAQIAKRFNNVTLRGGIIESTGGAGVDYHLMKDKIKLSAEAYDFDNDRGAHLKLSATVFVSKYFFVTGGYDNFATKMNLSSGFLGAGFHFEDEDLKYMFSSAPPVKF